MNVLSFIYEGKIIQSFMSKRCALNCWLYLSVYSKSHTFNPLCDVYFLSEVKVKSLSRVQLFATPWTVAYHPPLSMGFSRQQYWSGLPFPSPTDLPDPGMEPRSPALQTDALQSEPPGKSILLNWVKRFKESVHRQC